MSVSTTPLREAAEAIEKEVGDVLRSTPFISGRARLALANLAAFVRVLAAEVDALKQQ